MFRLFSRKKSAFENLGATQFEEALKINRKAVVIDVRSPREFKQGHLPKAKNINVMDSNFADKIARLDKDADYYVYCRSGARSKAAAKLMTRNGFESVTNLVGGISGWSGKIVR
jgi:rhodanese-related sulfurtransferase